MIYLFDVDGTIAEAQQAISSEMEAALLQLSNAHQVYLVTGSDYDTLLDKKQLTPDMEQSLSGIFACMGCELWQKGKLVHKNDHKFPPQLRFELGKILETSDYPVRKGRHIVERTGMINFSIIGRHATPVDRRTYENYDRDYGEREKIVKHLSGMFKEYDFHIGGKISIDICPKDQNKSQIIEHLPGDSVMFMGDKMQEGGNDYHLATLIEVDDLGVCYAVDDPEDALTIIETILAAPL